MNNTIESFLDTVRTVLNYPLLTLGESSLTLAIILKLLLLFALVLVAETLLRRHLAMRLLQRTSLDAPLQYGIARIGGYLFIPLGFYAPPPAHHIFPCRRMASSSQKPIKPAST